MNTTSVSGLRGNFGQANYGAAKAGVFGLTRVSAIELAKIGCRVNAIAPVALTRMTEDVGRLREKGGESMGTRHVAPVAVWLASELASEVSGRVFGVECTHVYEYAMQTSAGITAPPEGDAWTPWALAANLGELELDRPRLAR